MASSKSLEKTSKFLSLVLRHRPDTIDLQVDANGWANIEELISKANASGKAGNMDRALLQQVVDTSDKKRFIVSGDGEKIRANQGHSINVDLQLDPVIPPDLLYHGTATRFLDIILREGLKPQQRQHVHLSQDIETALAVGQRYGKPVILRIPARLMHDQGFIFYRSENGVWLTDHVPHQHIEIQSES